MTREQLDELLTWVSEHRSRLETHLIRETLYVHAATRRIADEFGRMLSSELTH